MRCVQLFAALALIASASVSAAPEVAHQAGPVGHARAFDNKGHAGVVRRRFQQRDGTRKCRPRPTAAAPTTDGAAPTTDAAKPTTDAATPKPTEDSAAPDAPDAPSSSSAQAPSPTDAPTDNSSSAERPTSTASSEAPAQTATGNDNGSSDNALQSFTMTGGGGSIGSNLIATDPSHQSGNFDSMTNTAYNALVKTAYGNLVNNGDGSLTYTYKKGQLASDGSWFWYTTQDPGSTGMDLTTAKTATFTYKVRFQDGFQWQLGGKLPGWYGGDSQEHAKGCTGHDGNEACFSSRLMWRPDGFGELYNYYYAIPAQAYCDLESPTFWLAANPDPKHASVCHHGSGDSLGRGAFSFRTGDWVEVKNTITLNDVGKANGAQTLKVDGQVVIQADQLVLRDNDASRIRGLFFSTFFGGDGSSYASPQQQTVDFSEIGVSIDDTL